MPKCNGHNSLIAVLCVGIFAVGLSISTSSDAAPPTSDVNVVNTPSVNVVNTASNPVPVSVQGTGSVSGSVAVTNTASNPVPTQSVGGGAATHVGQPASKLIELYCQRIAGVGGVCTKDYNYTGPYFYVPDGQALVITDFEWQVQASLAGTGDYDNASLAVWQGALLLSATQVYAQKDAAGRSAGQLHLTSGIVAPPGGNVIVSAAGNVISSTVHGYLVSNQ